VSDFNEVYEIEILDIGPVEIIGVGKLSQPVDCNYLLLHVTHKSLLYVTRNIKYIID
jgi:hypothetical protein